MKPNLAILLCFLILTALPAVAGELDPAEAEAVERFLELTRAEDNFYAGMEAGFAAGMDPQMNPALAAIPEAKLQQIVEEVGALMREDFDWESIRPGFVQLVAETYTLEELGKVNEALDDPSIAMMFERQADFIARSTRLSTERMQELQPKILALTQEILSRP